jgi:hypothetical protein
MSDPMLALAALGSPHGATSRQRRVLALGQVDPEFGVQRTRDGGARAEEFVSVAGEGQDLATAVGRVAYALDRAQPFQVIGERHHQALGATPMVRAMSSWDEARPPSSTAIRPTCLGLRAWGTIRSANRSVPKKAHFTVL